MPQETQMVKETPRKIRMLSMFYGLLPGAEIGPDSEYYGQLSIMAEIKSTITPEGKMTTERICEFIEFEVPAIPEAPIESGTAKASDVMLKGDVEALAAPDESEAPEGTNDAESEKDMPSLR